VPDKSQPRNLEKIVRKSHPKKGAAIMAEEAQSPTNTPKQKPEAHASEPSRTRQQETTASTKAQTLPSSEAKPKAAATEKPIPNVSEKRQSQYVVTVDNRTGGVLKIEKLDSDTSERKELTADEYAGVLAYANLSSPYLAGLGAYAMSQPVLGSVSAVQAYYRGLADYFYALSSSSK
jgi:hypothetical protein